MDAEAKPFLASDSNDSHDPEYTHSYFLQEPDSRRRWVKTTIKYLITFALAIVLGFFLGRHHKFLSSSKSSYGGLLRADSLNTFSLIAPRANFKYSS
jgi:hypothetical protein